MQKKKSTSTLHLKKSGEETNKEYLYREIEERKKAEEALRNINRSLQILNETAIILNAEKYTPAIYADISHKLKELTGGVSVTMSIYDPVKSCLTLKHMEMEVQIVESLLKAVGGKSSQEINFPVSDEDYRTMVVEPVRYLNTLNEASLGLIPKRTGESIQKINNINRFLSIAYFIDNELYGASNVSLVSDTPELSMDIIQSFIQMVSVAFRRKRAEDMALAATDEALRLLKVADKSRRALLSVVEDERRVHEELAKLNEELEDRVSRRTAQLELANKEMEAFSYSVSHDLRAPLRAMNGFSKILQEEHLNNLDPEVNRILQIIIDNAKKMGYLIDDLLSLSRLGRQELRFSRISMKLLANSVFLDLISMEDQNKIEFCLRDIPDSFGDPSLVRQVFLNLIGNAIKFSSLKPKPVIEVDCYTTETENVYSVKDNGAGFDMTYSNKLFGVFQRLHTISEFEGTGVGLAIVQRIILRMKGRVWAEGIVDQGATFYFSLPLRQ
jgi:signal transduction histidine kinase